jgi:hypothetical protein
MIEIDGRVCNILSGNPNGRDHLNVRILLKWIVGIQSVTMETGIIWVRREISGPFF